MVSVLASHQGSARFYFGTSTSPYIHNDLPENLQSTVKLFADDRSLFSIGHEPNISASQLESNLKKNSHWAYKRK